MKKAGQFGHLLLKYNLATPEQILECLKIQSELSEKGISKALGEIMVEKRYLTWQQVKEILEIQGLSLVVCQNCNAKINVEKDWSNPIYCPMCRNLVSITAESLKQAEGKNYETPVTTFTKDKAEVASPIGKILGGCRILELIGKGAMASVYKGRHLGLDRDVAIKLLPASQMDKTYIRRLVFEAKTIAKIEHPNILQVYDVGMQENFVFIIMQLLKGVSLENKINEMGKLPVSTAIDIICQIAQGLSAAHQQGIVHRDLKPSNIIITEHGIAKIIDFGVARRVEVTDELKGYTVGTPYYMAPEQWLGYTPDARADLYSLGVIAYKMLTGSLPFFATSISQLMALHLRAKPKEPRELNPEISWGLNAIIVKLLQKSPAKRYKDANDLLSDLNRLIAGSQPLALDEVSRMIKCSFCQELNPPNASVCKTCGENLVKISLKFREE